MAGYNTGNKTLLEGTAGVEKFLKDGTLKIKKDDIVNQRVVIILEEWQNLICDIDVPEGTKVTIIQPSETYTRNSVDLELSDHGNIRTYGMQGKVIVRSPESAHNKKNAGGVEVHESAFGWVINNCIEGNVHNSSVGGHVINRNINGSVDNRHVISVDNRDIDGDVNNYEVGVDNKPTRNTNIGGDVVNEKPQSNVINRNVQGSVQNFGGTGDILNVGIDGSVLNQGTGDVINAKVNGSVRNKDLAGEVKNIDVTGKVTEAKTPDKA